MKETLLHQITTQEFGLPASSPGNHSPDGPNAGHAPKIKVDHSGGADKMEDLRRKETQQNPMMQTMFYFG